VTFVVQGTGNMDTLFSTLDKLDMLDGQFKDLIAKMQAELTSIDEKKSFDYSKGTFLVCVNLCPFIPFNSHTIRY
jgi:hypothetical protein